MDDYSTSNNFELNYSPFVNSLNKYNGRVNAVDDWYPKSCFLSDSIDANVKVFNVIIKKLKG